MNKAEMESSASQHDLHMSEARSAESRGFHEKALKSAILACNCLDGMMQYRQKYEGMGSFRKIASIDMVLRWAPAIFDMNSVEVLRGILRERRRIEKKAPRCFVWVALGGQPPEPPGILRFAGLPTGGDNEAASPYEGAGSPVV